MAGPDPGGWRWSRTRGPAARQHGRGVTEPAGREVWVHEVDRPALVLGSTQGAQAVDLALAERRGVEVVRRRSGGGAVLLVPGQVLWVDVVVPAGDPLWDDDVGRAAWWLGERWAVALAEQGWAGEVHRGGLDAGPWGSLLCFAGLGPGEVVVGGRKVVGLSQRRTRGWARFQCLGVGRWDPGPVLELLVLEAGERAAAARDAPGWHEPPSGAAPLDLVALEAALVRGLGAAGA